MGSMDIIKTRRSVRSFDGKPLSPEELDGILRFAESAENPYGIAIEWKLLDAREQGLTSNVISGTDCFIAGKVARVPHAEEAFGFSFERMVLYAWAKGIGTTWIGGTMDRPAFERAMNVGEGEFMPCVSPLGRPAAKMSIKETIMRKGVGADSRLPFEKLFFSGSFGSPMSKEDAGELADAFEMVRLGPSAVNKQPWRAVTADGAVHFFEQHAKGYGGGAWDVQKIDLGIALCHFACGLEELGRSFSLVTEDPGIEPPAACEYIASFRLG
ncbi:MAG: nitroreductase [Clostridia bacterium]|nr:nitroreductase [Clostridia bacterium]